MFFNCTCCVRFVKLWPLISLGAPTAAPVLPLDDDGKVLELYEVGDNSFSWLPKDPLLSSPHFSPGSSSSSTSIGSVNGTHSYALLLYFSPFLPFSLLCHSIQFTYIFLHKICYLLCQIVMTTENCTLH